MSGPAKPSEETAETHERQLGPDTVEFEDTVALLASIQRVDAPTDLAGSVESRIRRRSRGRFFSEQPVNRWATYLGAGVMLVILLALWLMTQVGELRDAETGKTAEELRQEQVLEP